MFTGLFGAFFGYLLGITISKDGNKVGIDVWKNRVKKLEQELSDSRDSK